MSVRFAPSPTSVSGGLHVGGSRTALINLLYSKKFKIPFILRIEDTDEARSTKESYEEIAKDLIWSGVSWDMGPSKNIADYKENQNKGTLNPRVNFFQSENKEVYKNLADILVSYGYAHVKDGCTYLKAFNNSIAFNDAILGSITSPSMDNKEDFVIMKSSGMPSFYFAGIVDDINMGITVVIRGQEHINSTFKQLIIRKRLQDCGVSVGGLPVYYHIPLVMNDTGSKMSKRQTEGQVNICDFRRDGYLPNVINSYVLKLGCGWSTLGYMSFDHMVKEFDPSKLGTKPSRFEYHTLRKMNKSFINSMKIDDLHKAFCAYIWENYSDFWEKVEESDSRLRDAIDCCRRISGTLMDLKNNIEGLLAFNPYDNPLKNDILDKKDLLGKFFYKIEEMKLFDKENIHIAMLELITKEEVTFGELASLLRLSLTGKKVCPPIDHICQVIGKDQVLVRLNALELSQSKA